MTYDILVIGGGGAKGIASLGALHHAEKDIEGCKVYSGCSIGSIITALLAIGYKPLEIFSAINNYDFAPDLNFAEFFTKFGMIDISSVTNFIAELFEAKASREITFRDLKDFYNKELFIVATKYSTKEPEYFSVHSHPDMKILEAVNMSCNIPLIFSQYTYSGDGEVYLDGGLCDNLPIHIVRKFYPESEKKILCIMMNFTSIETESASITSKFLNYVTNVMAIPVITNSKRSIKLLGEKDKLVQISVDVPTLSYNISSETKFKMFKTGYAAYSSSELISQ